MRISDCSSDVCSSDLDAGAAQIATRVAVEHALVIDIFGAEYEMAPAPGERRAERDVHPIARSVATGRDAGMGPDRETLQILFEQDVDHASDGARPPGREIGRASCRESVCPYG